MPFKQLLLSVALLLSMTTFFSCKEKEEIPCVAGPCAGIPDAPQGGYRTVGGTYQLLISVDPNGSGKIYTTGTFEGHSEPGAFIVDTNNGEVTRFETQELIGRTPFYSNNGELIYSDAARIWKQKADGTGEELILDRPGISYMAPSVSQDGKKVALIQFPFAPDLPSLVIWDRETNTIDSICRLNSFLSISPNGEYVAAYHGTNTLSYVDILTGKNWYLPSLNYSVYSAKWANNNEDILWVGSRRFINTCGEYDTDNAIFSTNIHSRTTKTIVKGCENRTYDFIDIERTTGNIYAMVTNRNLIDEFTISIEKHIWRISPNGRTQEQLTF